MALKSPQLLPAIIVFATLSVVSMQVILSLKNYKEQKEAVKTEINHAINQALEQYYLEDAKEEFVTIIDKVPNRKFKSFAEAIQFDSIQSSPLDSVRIVEDHKTKTVAITSYEIVKGRLAADSISRLKNKGNTIYFPLKKESLRLEQIDARFKQALEDEGLSLNYELAFYKADRLEKVIKNSAKLSFSDTIQAHSIYLPEKSNLKLSFTNPIPFIWKKSLNGILLSTILSLLIIACLFYLLRIIRLQNQNNEIKNDFVSNITHEFKTPIATASSALEALQKYNADDDKEKSKRYAMLAQENILKLNQLTDKILDTAAMENRKLTLHLKAENIIDLLQKIISKYQSNTQTKKIHLIQSAAKLISDVDVFYFENALNNIVDNALKYGGDTIEIDVISSDEDLRIRITDNGMGIEKKHAEKIFDKFYRVPQGNLHLVRGFGIGLYHSKKIIESHGGTLILLSHKPPVFEICLPHA